VDFADIVNQNEQSPLYIHFGFGPQIEAVHKLMYTNVGKDRLMGMCEVIIAPLSLSDYVYSSGDK
jgi:hypothetical protein